MHDPERMIPLASLLGAAALWLMLPRGNAGGRSAGVVLAAVALGLAASQLESLGGWTANGMFFLFAGMTAVAAVATITFRSPLYCAIWFGMTLAGVASLFLLIEAEFLAVATLLVYAGAILVTFLFVLMLAQPKGHASYDRLSWEPLLAASTGAVMVGILTMMLAQVFHGVPAKVPSAASVPVAASVPLALPVPAGEAALAQGILSPQHVAHLGQELYGRHMVAVEVAGVLLLAAVVGAAVIVAHGSPRKPSSTEEI